MSGCVLHFPRMCGIIKKTFDAVRKQWIDERQGDGMKVLMTTMKMDIGGAETHILEAAKELAMRGITVYVASAGGVYEKELTQAGVHHVYAPLDTRNPIKVIRAFRILCKLIREEHFDVVHAHARIPAVLCHLICKKYRVHFVTTAHLNFSVNGLWRLLSRWGERTVAVSDDIKQYLIDDYGVCTDNISVTINGINTETFSPDIDPSSVMKEFDLAKDKRRIVLVSRMDTDRSEAAIQLADIAPRLYEAYPDVEILLVGDGNDFGRLRESAECANRTVGKEIVKTTGARTDINRLIAAGEIFIGVSRAALEAMAMEKPVIVAGNQGYLGIFTEDKLALAYDSNFCCRGCPMTDRDTLCADVLRLLSMSDSDRALLGKTGRDTIMKYYSVSRMAQDYIDMYEAVRPFAPYKYGDVLFCGYYGFGNTGDDSLLRAIIENLRKHQPDIRITVMSKTPRRTAAIYGTHAIHRFSPFAVLRAMKHGRLLIFGGGNLLQDGSSRRSLWYYTLMIRLAKRMKMKVMVYANGIGPLNAEKSRRATAAALSEADCITLRERASVEMCKKLGVCCPDIRLTADPAFTLREANATWTAVKCRAFGIDAQKRYFMLALRDWKTDAESNMKKIAAICDQIADTYGMIPVFLPMHDPLDVEVNRKTASLCRCETVFLSGLTGSEILGIMHHMEFVAAMRLHTLIYSTTVGVSSLGMAYDEKITAFMDSMQLPCVSADIEEALFMERIADLIVRKEELHEMLTKKIKESKLLADGDAQCALRMIGLLSDS